MTEHERRQGRPDSRDSEQSDDERRMDERRRDARVPVNIWVEEYMGDDLYIQQAGNISVGGVFFERTIPHPIGTRIKLRFELPGREGLIETLGEVVSAPEDPAEYGAGVRFVDLDPVEEKLLRNFVDEYLKKNP